MIIRFKDGCWQLANIGVRLGGEIHMKKQKKRQTRNKKVSP